MRWLAIAFGVLILALQYPMWLGKGGWLQVREYDRQLAAQREANARLKMRNDALDADVRDLKTGSEAIEERARAELGKQHVMSCSVREVKHAKPRNILSERGPRVNAPPRRRGGPRRRCSGGPGGPARPRPRPRPPRPACP